MTEPNPNYDHYVAEMKTEQERKKNRHTVYLSRRAIWANILLIIVFSGLAGYIHTRRWKALGIFFGAAAIIGGIAGAGSKSFEESLQRSFELGQELAPLLMVVSAVDNGLAIGKARKQVSEQSSHLSK